MPGVPGLFIEEQKAGWKRIASAIHEKGGVAYMQLWHSGRANIPHMTGSPIYSSSATPWDDPQECFMFPPPHTSDSVRYVDFPPKEMSIEKIKQTIQDYVRTAKWAVECGFDGVEVHGGNGYLIEQFLASNINKRTDAYGGDYEKRCAFALELMDELSKAIGEENVAIRLTPFGLFNQMRSEQRLETWQTLCKKLKESHPKLSYVSFVEPVSWLTFCCTFAYLADARYVPTQSFELRHDDRLYDIVTPLQHCTGRPKHLRVPHQLTTKHRDTNKSTASERSNPSSNPGASLPSTCLLSAKSLATRHSSAPAASTTRTPGEWSSRKSMTACCLAGTSSATRTCRDDCEREFRSTRMIVADSMVLSRIMRLGTRTTLRGRRERSCRTRLCL